MTKIWCAICHKSDFGVYPPTQQHVLDHIRAVHGFEKMTNSIRCRDLWSMHQNLTWEMRRRELRSKLRESNKRAEQQAAEDEDTIVVGAAALDRAAEDVQQQWEDHMCVYDDSEAWEDASNRLPQLALSTGGTGYKTSAERSSQVITAVERMTADGVHQQMFIPAGAQGVGWDSMAESGFLPVGARKFLEPGHGLSQGGHNQQSSQSLDRELEETAIPQRLELPPNDHLYERRSTDISADS